MGKVYGHRTTPHTNPLILSYLQVKPAEPPKVEPTPEAPTDAGQGKPDRLVGFFISYAGLVTI